MSDKYSDCDEICKDYYYDNDEKECIFKRLCVAAELPIVVKNNE
ncbi:hypothetical protein [Clostridium saccharobutylicum]|uniref:Uncharacterized protein n=1 Tax=Clostridium saccharobutylicum DSM 13864 TaxID=1345695 RepID=U5MTW8_CLOSA|nr:hypothetical protein [Clostridium saccharobutylicum]AGX43963.1 hypothetical protein CLSA_c29960 [Clostridium saccharobutylicum DSM 13864]AQR91260.1 hypothetical protein CLOSC_29840 [Clostridium saccharobutylicum]AQS01164.1 hypothetical protein CSACC_29910 [Clostridium saccharobutylicum]AQS10577.1 hypothetical protein CLOBY_27220 [Clostridium saccharobutylicum]AQS15147.1 hypothetical protein CLOSACC_29910 [Clostridium saccharobutylicum]